MKFNGVFFVRRVLKDTGGQTLPFVVLGLTFFIGLAGVTTDLGHGYAARRQLQEATNSAALAGAAGMPDTTVAGNYVTTYSVMPGEKNASPNLQNPTVTTTFGCLSTVTTNLGVGCVTSTGTTAGSFNALKVTQTAQVPLWFGRMFGVPTFNIWATATAAMKGGTNTPWNIAIIVDTTASMAGSKITNALLGVQALLLDLDPCALDTTCAQGIAPVDSVSLFVFPSLTIATATDDYTCPTSNPTIVAYTVPTLPTTDTYQVTPTPTSGSTTPAAFSNNYRASDAATSLNTSAQIVIAAGGKSGCNGIQAPGGRSTYYAQAIYAAQAALVAQQKANPGSQNAMIILTDGDAEATVDITGTSKSGSYSGGGVPANYASGSDMIPSALGSLNGVTGNNPTSYTYPSAVGECGQGVKAAIDAATNSSYNNAGSFTRVYTIGYGAETTGGSSYCTTDKTYSGSYTGGGGSWAANDSPCQAMAAMASNTAYFYSDDTASCKATLTSNQNFTNLTAIFEAIRNGLTTSRLIPNGTK